MGRKKKEHADRRDDQQHAPRAGDEQVEAGARQGSEKSHPDRDELLARLKRVSADYLNYQKRIQKDIAAAREFANEQLIKDLLVVLDDMERAMAAARANHSEDDPLLMGMQLVHDKAIGTLGRFGLTAIDAVGKPFDPQKHSAVMQEPSAEHPPQTVIKEAIKGYQLKGRTIRPASVVVSTAAEDEPERQDNPQQDAEQRKSDEGREG